MLSTVTDHPTDRVDDGDAAAAADGGGGDEGDVCHPLQSRLWSYLSIIILRPIESHFPKCLHIIYSSLSALIRVPSLLYDNSCASGHRSTNI